MLTKATQDDEKTFDAKFKPLFDLFVTLEFAVCQRDIENFAREQIQSISQERDVSEVASLVVFACEFPGGDRIAGLLYSFMHRNGYIDDLTYRERRIVKTSVRKAVMERRRKEKKIRTDSD